MIQIFKRLNIRQKLKHHNTLALKSQSHIFLKNFNFIIRLDASICAASKYIKNYLKISLKNKTFRISVLI